MKMMTALAATMALACSPALAKPCADAAGRAAAWTPAVHHTAASTPAKRGDIVDVAVGAGQFTTLVAAVQAAGLVDVLKGAGPFTVFAPTDAAFAKLPGGTVESLLRPENRARLQAILTYHVLPGRVAAGDLAGRRLSPATVEGRTVSVDGRDGVRVNGARVVTADVMASNGIVHVIDTVLMPPARTH
jgi:uncharacterized surface protein with fasciclin (FAS1) repeats